MEALTKEARRRISKSRPTQAVWMGFVFCISIFVSPSLRAHYQIVESLSSHNPIYEFLENGNGEDRVSGVYVFRKRTEASQLLLPGRVLGLSRAFKGPVSSLSMTSSSGRDETMAILDNTLVLFSKLTNDSIKDSFARIGIEDNPLIDPAHHLPFILGPITDVDDVQIIEKRSLEGQLVIVSVKQNNPFGTGVTFAFGLRIPTQSTPKLDFSGAPVILNYRFLDQAALSHLSHQAKDGSTGLISDIVLNSLANKPDNPHSPTGRWRRDLNPLVTGLNKPRRSGGLAQYEREILPLIYPFQSGAIKVERRLTEVLRTEGKLALVQVTEPIEGVDHLLFRRANLPLDDLNFLGSDGSDGSDVVSGRVDRTSNGKVLLSSHSGQEPSTDFQDYFPNLYSLTKPKEKMLRNSIVASVGKTLYVGYVADGKIFSFRLGRIREAESISEIQHIHWYLAALKRHVIIVSWKGKPSKTIAFIAHENFPGDIGNIEPVYLKDTFLVQEDLLARSLPFEEKILFNDLDPVATLRNERLRGEVSTKPYIDLLDHAKRIYLAANRKYPLEENGFAYLVFAPANQVQNRNGVYRISDALEVAERLSLITSGSPIPLNEGSDQEPFGKEKIAPATRASFQIPNKVASLPGTSLTISIYPLKNNVGQLDIFTAVRISGFPEALSHKWNTSISLEDFQGVVILRGRRDFSDRFSIIVFKKNKAGGGAVYAVCFTVDSDSSTPNIVPYDWRALSISPIEMDVFRRHVVFDEAGAPIWIENPDLSKQNPNFFLIPFYGGVRSSIAELSKRPLWEEPWDSPTDQGGLGRSWKVYADKDIVDRWPKAAAVLHLDAPVKKKWELENQGAVSQLFPGLPELFDELSPNNDKSGGSTDQLIFLVTSEMKAHLQAAFVNRFRPRAFAPDSSSTNLYLFNGDETFPQMRRQLELITHFNENAILLVDAEDLVPNSKAAKDLEVEEAELGEDESEDTKGDTETDGQEAKANPSSALLILAGEGDDARFFEEPRRELPRHFPKVIFATPQELETIRKQPQNASALRGFEVRGEYLNSKWSWLPPKSPRASEEMKKYGRDGVSPSAMRVFPQLSDLLINMANGEERNHRIVIFPDELKPLAQRLILGRWASSIREAGAWNHANRHLALVKVPRADERVLQKDVMEAFQSIHLINETRLPVLVAELGDLIQIGRPDNGDSKGPPFALKAATASDASNADLRTAEGGGEAAGRVEQLPHIFWMIATEGSRRQPKPTGRTPFRTQYPSKVPTLLFGTRAELRRLRSDIILESGLADPLASFEIVDLVEPVVEIRRELVAEIFASPKILGLRLEYKYQGKSSRDPSGITANLVARVEQVARQLNMDITTTFIRAYSALGDFIVQDPTIRKTATFDGMAVERLLSRVFPVGIRLDSLPDEDPLKRISDSTKALAAWKEAGYLGQPGLKRGIMELHLGQTNMSRDQGRPIPFSFILVGKTSVGKSYAIETYLRMLGLKELNWQNNPFDPEADAFIVRVQELYEKEEIPGKLSVDRCLKIIDNLIYNNPRAIIFFDDLHKAQSGEIFKKVFTYISSLLETKGFFKVTNKDGLTREVPVVGLGLGLAVNPTQDAEIRRRFDAYRGVINEVVAALHRDDMKIEESFVARFSDIIDMSAFSADAKVESLISAARQSAAVEFVAHDRLFLFSPLALQAFADRFGRAHAREFLTHTLPAVLAVPPSIRGKIVLVDLKNTVKNRLTGRGTLIPKVDVEEVASASVRDEVRSVAQEMFAFREIDGEKIGPMMDFTSLIVDGFRIQTYHVMLSSMQEMRSISDMGFAQKAYLIPILLSVFDRLSHWPSVPLDKLGLNPQDMGFREEAKFDEFQVALSDRSENPNLADVFFPYRFRADSDLNPSRDRILIDLLAETAHQLTVPLYQLLASFYRIDDINKDLKDPSDWINQVEQRWRDPKSHGEGIRRAKDEVGKKISEIFVSFSEALVDSHYLENGPLRDEFSLAPIQSYDRARLFLYALDKALVSLPWSFLGRFSLEAMSGAAEDADQGRLPGLQQYIFESPFSPFSVVTPSQVIGSIEEHPTFKEVDPGKREQRRIRHLRLCRSLLVQPEQLIREGE